MAPKHGKRRARPGRWLVLAAVVLGGAAGLAAAMSRPAQATNQTERKERTESLAVLLPVHAPAQVVKPLPQEEPREVPTEAEPEPKAPNHLLVRGEIQRGESLSLALAQHGADREEIQALVKALKGTLDPRTIRAGDRYTLVENDATEGKEELDRLDRFEFVPRADRLTTIVAARAVTESPTFVVEKKRPEIETRVEALSGDVTTSLYDSMVARGEGVTLVNRFVDVFAWDLDFYRETRRGDHYKVIVEKRFAKDGDQTHFVGYGRVLAAEYKNGNEIMRGFNFKSADEKFMGTFDENGQARMKTFLKSPLEIARITSRYGQRFHPVLKRKRQHNGVDYGAPRGTAYWAVADGKVIEARYSKSAGKMIVVKHRNGYTTEYFHSARFAPGIKVGSKVKQRQVIGYVGSTGRSTGPHLHFGMKKGGRYVDPGRQKFPVARPVASAYTKEFKGFIGPLLAEMKSLPVS